MIACPICADTFATHEHLDDHRYRYDHFDPIEPFAVRDADGRVWIGPPGRRCWVNPPPRMRPR